MTVEYTPWFSRFSDLSIWHTTDWVLAENAVTAAITADDDADTEFAVAMTELFTLRARIFKHPNIAGIAQGSTSIEQQTRDATWIDPHRVWPNDTVRAALTLWKAGKL